MKSLSADQFHALSELLKHASPNPNACQNHIVVLTNPDEDKDDLIQLWSSRLPPRPNSKAHYAELTSIRKRLVDTLSLIDHITEHTRVTQRDTSREK